jgi:FKBP-type peptidyl-prolyl cis-trans isomerase
MKRTHRIRALVLLAALVACGESSNPTEPEDVTQMTQLPSGVYIQTVTPGTGDRVLTASDHWTIEYQFWLVDGTLLQEGPLRSELDCNPRCVEGFEIGILGMKVGETRKIVIPSRLGYGAEPPSSEIPKDAVLVYQNRLVGLR